MKRKLNSTNYTTPDYKRIYTDIIERKCPERKAEFQHILNDNKLTVIKLITLNNLIFENKDVSKNQKHRSYDKSAIFEILTYQKEKKLNDIQLSKHFNLSRNTISKWRRMFILE